MNLNIAHNYKSELYKTKFGIFYFLFLLLSRTVSYHNLLLVVRVFLSYIIIYVLSLVINLNPMSIWQGIAKQILIRHLTTHLMQTPLA